LGTSAGTGQAEIDLPFERVHFGHLHLDAVTQLEHTARASADELPAVGLELIEIVAQSRKWDEPAHAQSRDIDEKAEVAHIGYER
jgi:hypothetical protein